MVANKTVKIFIEPDEEIVFIIEKIMQAGSSRVILIVPSTAALISSAVSLKILSKRLVDSPILSVLVCDNEGAVGLAKKANLMMCKKVSAVTKDVWMETKALKEAQRLELNRLKAELLGERKEETISDKDLEEIEKIKEDKQEIKPVKATILDEPTPPVQPVITAKPRLKGRVIDIGKLKIYSGGDIKENQELLSLIRDRNNDGKVVNLTLEDASDDKSDDMDTRKKGLLGQDVIEELNSAGDTFRTRTTKRTPSGISKFFEKFSSFFKAVSIKKVLLGFVISLIAFFVVSYLFFVSVDVSITLSENKISAKTSITAKTDVKEVDVANSQIPAMSITKENTSSSEAQTTGIGYTGEYAQGTASFINTSSSPVTIKAGTQISLNSNSQLKYTIAEDLVIGAQGATTKTIKALNFGEEYNIKETLQEFTATGHSDIAVSNITQISGGTKSEVKVLSKEDIESLKASMEEQLKTVLINDMKEILNDDDILLTGSEKFSVVSFTTNFNENDQTDTFTADLKMTLTAMKVLKSDIKLLLSEKVKTENAVDRVQVSDPVLENLTIAENSATFDVRANADTANDVDLDVLKQEIAGKSVSEAKDYIKNLSGVEEVRIRYTPAYIPQSLQKIPDDLSKISMQKNTVLE
jgi:hypothetical protein